ncbi:MAG: acetylxylan esterase [Oscillospiraceae bacterium]|nr:acetylxylan esterase [Oscillospiraceae bacterium]
MTAAMQENADRFYPSAQEVDDWCNAICARTDAVTVQGEELSINNITPPFGNGPNARVNTYVRFTASDGRRVFYGYLQRAISGPAPLLINLPGYGGCMNLHPQISDMGYTVLHISPLGYITPDGEDKSLQDENGNYPVLMHTAQNQAGGYADFLSDCLLAIRWASALPDVYADRISLYGTSQGGGTALLLASVLNSKVRCVCADLPFLTSFALSGLAGDAYGLLQPVQQAMPAAAFWHNIGFADTLSHAHRITVPTMLSCGGKDDVCPPCTVNALFDALTCTKQLSVLNHVVHGHSRESMFLFSAWLRMFA